MKDVIFVRPVSPQVNYCEYLQPRGLSHDPTICALDIYEPRLPVVQRLRLIPDSPAQLPYGGIRPSARGDAASQLGISESCLPLETCRLQLTLVEQYSGTLANTAAA